MGFWKAVWGDKLDWFIKNTKYLIDKHGEKEFAKQWKEAMREKVINQLKEQATPEKIEEFKVSLENLGGEGEGYGLRVLNFLDERLDQRAVLEKTLNQFGQKLEEVKNQKVNQLKARLETATDQLRTELLKPLQSGEIHSVEVLEAVKAKLTNPRAIEALENAQEKQIEQFNRRIEKIEDPVRIEKLKEQVEERPAIKRNIQKVVPQIMNKIENRLEIRKENQDKVEPISEQPRIDEPSEAEPDETVTNEAEGE